MRFFRLLLFLALATKAIAGFNPSPVTRTAASVAFTDVDCALNGGASCTSANYTCSPSACSNYALGAVDGDIVVIPATTYPTSGSYTLSFNGAGPSSSLAYNAPACCGAGSVQGALEGLSTIGVGQVTVTGSLQLGYEIQFVGTLAGIANLPLITASGTLNPSNLNQLSIMRGQTPSTNTMSIQSATKSGNSVTFTVNSTSGFINNSKIGIVGTPGGVNDITNATQTNTTSTTFQITNAAGANQGAGGTVVHWPVSNETQILVVGNCWHAAVTIAKNVHLKGGSMLDGANNTRIIADGANRGLVWNITSTSADDTLDISNIQTHIVTNYSTNASFLHDQVVMEVDGTTRCHMVGGTPGGGFSIHDCRFTLASPNSKLLVRAIAFGDWVTGVMWHCWVNYPDTLNTAGNLIDISHTSQPGLVTSGTVAANGSRPQYGQYSWSISYDPTKSFESGGNGDNDAIFIEDNVLEKVNVGLDNSDLGGLTRGGGRVVYRHNTAKCNIGGHGFGESGNTTDARWISAYHNYVYNPGTPSYNWTNIRSGVGLWWNNRIDKWKNGGGPGLAPGVSISILRTSTSSMNGPGDGTNGFDLNANDTTEGGPLVNPNLNVNGGVNYTFPSVALPQSVSDGVTNGTSTVTSATACITSSDVGISVSGSTIPSPAFIGTVVDGRTFTLSSSSSSNVAINAGTGSGITITFGNRVISDTRIGARYAVTCGGVLQYKNANPVQLKLIGFDPAGAPNKWVGFELRDDVQGVNEHLAGQASGPQCFDLITSSTSDGTGTTFNLLPPGNGVVNIGGGSVATNPTQGNNTISLRWVKAGMGYPGGGQLPLLDGRSVKTDGVILFVPANGSGQHVYWGPQEAYGLWQTGNLFRDTTSWIPLQDFSNTANISYLIGGGLHNGLPAALTGATNKPDISNPSTNPVAQRNLRIGADVDFGGFQSSPVSVGSVSGKNSYVGMEWDAVDPLNTSVSLAATTAYGPPYPHALRNVASPPTFTSLPTKKFSVGTAEVFTVTTDGNPVAAITISSGTPPTGVTFRSHATDGTYPDDGTATISWSSSATSGGSFTMQAANGNAPNASQSFSITIANPPVITSSLTSSATIGVPYSYSITATNSPTSYGATGLPSGLSVNTATGAITGTTPGAAGTYTVAISATNADGTDNQNLVLTVSGSVVSGYPGATVHKQRAQVRRRP